MIRNRPTNGVEGYTHKLVVLDKVGEILVRLSRYLFNRLRAVFLCPQENLLGEDLRKLNPQLVDYCSRWGYWLAKPCKGLDFPSMTAEARMLLSPGRSTALNISPEYHQDHVARAVENAMQDIEPGLRTILWWRYVQNAGPNRLAECLGCSRGSAMWQLEKAHSAIAKVMRVRLYA